MVWMLNVPLGVSIFFSHAFIAPRPGLGCAGSHLVQQLRKVLDGGAVEVMGREDTDLVPLSFSKLTFRYAASANITIWDVRAL